MKGGKVCLKGRDMKELGLATLAGFIAWFFIVLITVPDEYSGQIARWPGAWVSAFIALSVSYGLSVLILGRRLNELSDHACSPGCNEEFWRSEYGKAVDEIDRVCGEFEAWKRDEAHALWVLKRIGKEMGEASRGDS